MIEKEIKYSIIIPAYNEEKLLPRLLNEIVNQRKGYSYEVEIIIADGGSSDNTVYICDGFDAKIVHSEKGRGKQLIEGVKYSSGQILIFLHADLQIPENMFLYLDNNLEEGTDIAVFRMKFERQHLLYKFYSFFTHFDSIFSTFGDQGIIASRSFYDKLGGFKDFPIMEDVDLFRRARKITKIRKLKEYVTASTRRFESVGLIKTQIQSMIYILGFLCGANPRELYLKYYQVKNER